MSCGWHPPTAQGPHTAHGLWVLLRSVQGSISQEYQTCTSTYPFDTPVTGMPGHSHCDKLKTIDGCDSKVFFLTLQPRGMLSNSWRSRPRKSEEMRRTSPLDADIWRVCRRLEEFLTLLRLYFSTYFDMDFLKEVKLNFSA